jgi:DNA-binding PadR family transcriptional regulator
MMYVRGFKCACILNQDLREQKMPQTSISLKKEITSQLTKNLLDTIILELLSKKDMHGYQIIINIHKNYGITFGPSTVYPLLNQLEKKGQLKSTWDMTSERPRKVYKITENGKSILSYSENAILTFCRNIVPTTNVAFVTNY